VAKIHAIGGTAAVSAAQLTSADAAGTIAGPVATITALPGQSSVTIAFSQTVTATSAGLSTGYSIFGPGTPPTISSVAYSTTKNTVTLTLGSALQTTDVVRVNAGIVSTAAGLSVGQTDYTVVTDGVTPTCTLYAATGTAKIVVTCSELVVEVGTLDTDVDTKVTVGGVALGTASADEQAAGSKVVTITDDANFTATGASIVILKDLLKDLAGNKVGQLTGTVITDTKAPTVVGLPTYTTTGLTAATHRLGEAKATVVFDGETTLTAVEGGESGNFITIKTVDAAQNPACAVSGSGTIASPKLITITWDIDGTGGAVSTDQVGVDIINNTPACSAIATAVLTGTSANVAAAIGTAVPLAGGKDAALNLTSVATGVSANGYEIVITDNGTSGCVVTYAASTKTVSVAHDTGATDFCTPSAMKTAIETHSDTKGLFNIALGNNARDVAAQNAAAGAFTGGTTRLTVTSNFSEAVTVDANTEVMYDADGDDADENNYASVSGSGTSAVTTTYTLDGTTNQVVPAANTSEIQYSTGITDLAGNAMLKATPLLSAP
jgi:hypothetical protein